MSADQAFDNLAGRDELPIPVAAGAAGPAPVPDFPRPPEAGGAMRVDSLLDEVPHDYRPGGGAGNGAESARSSFNYPTETELAAVRSDAEEVDDAHTRGAHVVGRDTDAAVSPLDEPEADYREAREVDDDDSRLAFGRARRLPRFAYLPLQGMEGFEAGARDMAARLAAQDRGRPSLAITSPGRGEGRTELAIRLALAMAKKVDSRVLLVDFDLRKPGVAARLGVSNKYFTVTDVLRGSCRLGDALVVSGEDNLYVLPARANDREGDEILDGGEVEALFADIHESFDYAFVDCAPLVHADAMIVCRQAGFAAIAGMPRVSLAAKMNQAARRLTEEGVRVAGMVLAN